MIVFNKLNVTDLKEIQLFRYHYAVSYMIWRLGHEANAGRLNRAEAKTQIEQYEKTDTIICTEIKNRIIIPKLKNASQNNINKSFINWYENWNNYISTMSIKEYEEFEDIELGEDLELLENFKPKINWKIVDYNNNYEMI